MRGLAAILILCACHNNDSTVDATIGGSDSSNDADALGDASPDANEGSGFRIGGVATGMREPTRVVIDVGLEHRELLVTEDGPFRFPRRFPSGAMFTVSTPSTRCRLTNATGMLTGEITNVGLYCIGVVELASVAFTPPVIALSPGFQPDGFLYAGSRPYFGLAADLISATPVALYPTESTIAVYGAATASGQPSAPHAYGPEVPVTLTHTLTGLAATYSFRPDPLPRFESYLKASDPAANASFGSAMVAGMAATCGGSISEYGNGVALSGDTLVVGAPCAGGSGAAYVYSRNGTSWAFAKKLVASNPDAGDQFGAAVAIDGDTIVVGAPFEAGNNNMVASSGAIYVFKRGTNNWSDPPAYVKASSPAAGARFGNAVAVDGTTLVAGAPFDANGGTAYVFTFGTSWTQQASFRGSATAANDQFGFSVSISGNRVACGSPHQTAPIDGGAAYVFLRSGTTWAQQAQLRSTNIAAGDFFGWSVSLDGNYLAIGAPNENFASTPSDSGAAYVFESSGTVWSEAAYLKAKTPHAGDQLGIAVALARDALVVGVWNEDGHATAIDANENFGAMTANVGAAFVYRRTTGWGDRHYIKAPNSNDGDFFGASVAADGDTFAVGAFAEDSGVVGNMMDESAPKAGAVYVFR